MKKISTTIFPIKVFKKGFILPFTMLISAIILFITTGAMTLLSKQLYFSKIYKQSQTAYYAADDAVTCTIAIDDTYIAENGIGIFPYSTTTDPSTYIDSVLDYVNDKRVTDGLPTITLNEISCAQSAIFDQTISEFEVSPTPYLYATEDNGTEEGRTTSFNMSMDLGDGLRRCARVTVNKTQSFRQIIAQGYAQCNNTTLGVERAVVNTSITE